MADPDTVASGGVIAAVLSVLGIRWEHGRKQIVSSIEGVNMKVVDINNKVSRLLTMHEHPDDSGFGSARTNETLSRIEAHQMSVLEDLRKTNILMRESTAATKDLVKFLRGQSA